ncbi:hypothetical protein LAU42_04125 [Macrococcus armenti]|uniref:hypothetical protein n=1 Tax=Macrococcus armenti TaxID=2875764 RepID=UPI001CCFCD05|nr:hypothetical protein [Macrococcus armenti]UBH23135.1 hypothetical protein LAU42_04125 [Macrococcus armenti]
MVNRHAQEIIAELKNDDIQLKAIEFNVRGEDVVATFLYDDLFESDDVHTAPRPKDPMFLKADELDDITFALKEKGIDYTIRNDEFI